MPYCGEKYSHRIRTVDGKTAGEPCNWYCNINDWEDWRQAMEALQAELIRKSGDLQAKATNMGRSDVFDKVAKLYIGPAENAITAAQAAEPTFLDTFPGDADISAAIGKAIESMNLMVCALEQIDLGYVELGLEAPATPGAVGAAAKAKGETDWIVWAKRAGIAFGVGALGYLVLRYWLNRRLLAAQAPPIDVRARERGFAA